MNIASHLNHYELARSYLHERFGNDVECHKYDDNIFLFLVDDNTKNPTLNIFVEAMNSAKRSESNGRKGQMHRARNYHIREKRFEQALLSTAIPFNIHANQMPIPVKRPDAFIDLRLDEDIETAKLKHKARVSNFKKAVRLLEKKEGKLYWVPGSNGPSGPERRQRNSKRISLKPDIVYMTPSGDKVLGEVKGYSAVNRRDINEREAQFLGYDLGLSINDENDRSPLLCIYPTMLYMKELEMIRRVSAKSSRDIMLTIISTHSYIKRDLEERIIDAEKLKKGSRKEVSHLSYFLKELNDII